MRGSDLKATLCALFLLTSSTWANQELEKISSGSLNFGRDLFNQFASQGNVVISPMSAYLALAMARLGAKGITEQEISKGLGLGSKEELAHGFPDLLGNFSSAHDARVVVANRIFVQDKFSMDSKFNERSEKILNATAEKIDFGNTSAADVINKWVRNATRHRILDIVKKGSVNAETQLMLVNVLYFRGPWNYRFYSPSEPRPFYLDQSKTVDTQFMSKEDYYGYADLQDLDAQLIELPYKEKDYSLVIILPQKKDGLSQLEKKLATANIVDLFAGIKSVEITLHLPKFQIEMITKLTGPLKTMGFSSMFSDNADFSALTGASGEKLKVSEVLQKTYFEIHENGTEAAASTSIRIVPISAKLHEQIINCDHPFVFYLMHKRSLVLFQGKFVDPRIERVEF